MAYSTFFIIKFSKYSTSTHPFQFIIVHFYWSFAWCWRCGCLSFHWNWSFRWILRIWWKGPSFLRIISWLTSTFPTVFTFFQSFLSQCFKASFTMWFWIIIFWLSLHAVLTLIILLKDTFTLSALPFFIETIGVFFCFFLLRYIYWPISINRNCSFYRTCSV